MIDKKLENSIIEKFLRRAVKRLTSTSPRYKHFQFNCNICGDSSNRSKKRGHLMLSEHGRDSFWVYKCFNEGDCACAGEGNAWPASKWLQESFPNLYKDYIRELMSKKDEKDHKKIEKQNEEYEYKLIRKRKAVISEKRKEELEDVKNFVPILKAKGEIVDLAVKLCKDRKIPEEIWNKFFVSTKGKIFRNRLIIPFYDNKDKIYYWQGRALIYGQDPKYLNRVLNKDNAIYNLYNVDRSKPVIVVEGSIDSMFIENCIAIAGLQISEKMVETLNSMDVYYLFDNDSAGRNKTTKYLEQKKNVFMWRKFKYFDKYADKQDINQVYLNNNLTKKFTFEELKSCFTNSYYDSVFI